MKAKTLCLLAGTAVPLILTGSVQAGFTGIKVVSKPNEFGLLVVNVYAEFDRPPTPDPDNPGAFIFHDLFHKVAGTANAPMTIQVIGGTFYNHAFGSATNASPLTALINGGFPSLAFDTFATINAKVSSPAFPDATTLAPGLPLIAGSVFMTTESGWGVTPLDPQSDPFNSDYGGPGNGQSLFAQFATADGSAIQGTMLIGGVSNNVGFQAIVSFFHVPGPGALWLLGAVGLLGSRRR